MGGRAVARDWVAEREPDARKFVVSSIVVSEARAGMVVPLPPAAQLSARAITAGANLLPAARGRADRARLASSCRSSRGRTPVTRREVRAGCGCFLVGLVQEGGAWPTTSRPLVDARASRARATTAAAAVLARHLGSSARPDLLRLLRLLRHGASASRRLLGYTLPSNFDYPLPLAHDLGVLAPLAHLALDLAARLRLHPARRRAASAGAHFAFNLIAHDAARSACGTAPRGASSLWGALERHRARDLLRRDARASAGRCRPSRASCSAAG